MMKELREKLNILWGAWKLLTNDTGCADGKETNMPADLQTDEHFGDRFRRVKEFFKPV